MNRGDFKQVRISSGTYREIETIVAQSATFTSVEEFVDFVLLELLFGEEREISPEDEMLLKKRMRELGYL